MLTLSTDLEHRSITDMAAVLWQATEALAPIRSSGQMAVVNASAQREEVILSSSMHKDNLQVFVGALRCLEGLLRPFFIKLTYS